VIVNTEETNPHSTAMIVSSYVRHHTLRPEQLSDLITTVHHALSHLGQPLETIAEIYPERVNCQIESSYDARFVLFEFNDHPLTTHADVLRVVRAAGGQR